MIEPNSHGDDFRRFPYASDFTEGRTNRGGIDLVREPQRLAEIHEAVGFPELLELLRFLNGPESDYMTLGCASGYEAAEFMCYVELTWRDQQKSQEADSLCLLDEGFREFLWEEVLESRLSEADAEAAWLSLRWESARYTHGESDGCTKLAIYCRGKDQADAGRTLALLRRFCGRSSRE